MGGTIEQMVFDAINAKGGAATYSLCRDLPFDARSIERAIDRLRRTGVVGVGRAERKGHHFVNVYVCEGARPIDKRGIRRAA